MPVQAIKFQSQVSAGNVYVEFMTLKYRPIIMEYLFIREQKLYCIGQGYLLLGSTLA